jgi:hypothetical protein
LRSPAEAVIKAAVLRSFTSSRLTRSEPTTSRVSASTGVQVA